MGLHKGSSWWEKASFSARFRHRLRSGGFRLRGVWLQILQTAVAACVAWFLADLLLGLDRPPTFAPIAAVISLGLAVGQRGRRAVELTLGVAFGILVADLLVSILGVGAVQAGIVVALAMTVAAFLGSQEIGVNEAAVSAMIIMITFQFLEAGLPLDRFLEALIGGATALLINALLPVNPERMVAEAAHPLFDESVNVLKEVAEGLDEGDAPRIQAAYLKAQEIDARVSGLKEAVMTSRETARSRTAPATKLRAPRTLRRRSRSDRADRPRRTGARPRSARGSTAR